MLKQDPEKWEAARAQAGKELDQKAANRAEAKKEIKGVATNFMDKNGQAIKANTLGAVTGLIGLGINGTQGMMVGAKIGSGFATGYMSNTTKTLNNQTQAAAQLVANMNADNPDFDIVAYTHAINAKSQNGGFEKVEEQLSQILDKISGLSESTKQNMSADIRKQITVDASGMSPDFINRLADKYNVPEDSRDEVVNGMNDYAKLAGDANFAKVVSTNVSAGRTVTEIANAAANTTNNYTTINNNVTVEGSNIDEAVSELNSQISETNQNIDNLNNNLDRVENDVTKASSQFSNVQNDLNQPNQQNPQNGSQNNSNN
jgi:uncharacterized coiled-coil protein SlyX